MQLTHILTAAFATLATAQRYHPHGYQLQQRDAVNNGSDSSSSSSSGTTTSNPAVQSSSSSINAVASTASFTQYGPCNDPTKTSCAWYSSTGYNAAISQAVYNGSPGSGPSGACGVCWKLSPDFPGANEIVVKVNNLCPDDGRNPLCSQAADVDVNFDLCQDSGAAAALFGSSNTEQVNGTAAIVGCWEWSGGANVCLPGVQAC